MGRTSKTLALVMQAAAKLGGDTPAWSNLLAYTLACYAGHSAPFDFAAAVEAQMRLSEPEQHALIAWVIYLEEARMGRRQRRA